MNKTQNTTTALRTVNSLMQPIEWQGQSYYTSQYFHVQYQDHMIATGRKLKHGRHDNFLRIIRAIPLFHHYVSEGDIVEVQREKCPQILRALFRSNQYKLLYLLNATAQAGLTQHLDDPASMSIAYQINQRVAEQSEQKLSDAFPELRAIVELVEGVAQARLAAAAAQQDAQTARQEAASASTKAELALQQQQWLTIREYVYLHQLIRQLPESQWATFGRYLTGYCLEQGIPVRKQALVGKSYDSEHSYHVEVLEAQLEPWLRRRQAQRHLHEVARD